METLELMKKLIFLHCMEMSRVEMENGGIDGIGNSLRWLSEAADFADEDGMKMIEKLVNSMIKITEESINE